MLMDSSIAGGQVLRYNNCMINNWTVIFYHDNREKSPVEEFINSLEKQIAAKIINTLTLIEEFGFDQGHVDVKKLTGTPLWEIRILGKVSTRVIYVTEVQNKVVLLHAFKKKSQKTPVIEIQTALRRLINYKR
jgi:phage-related protein